MSPLSVPAQEGLGRKPGDLRALRRVLRRERLVLLLDEVEMLADLVNEQIRANACAETRLMSMEDAMDSGAMALFSMITQSTSAGIRLSHHRISPTCAPADR